MMVLTFFLLTPNLTCVLSEKLFAVAMMIEDYLLSNINYEQEQTNLLNIYLKFGSILVVLNKFKLLLHI